MTNRRDINWQDQSGSTTLWMLGMALLVLTMGGLSVDVWQAVSIRAEIAARADAAASAGASGVALEPYRQTGEVVLDEALVRGRIRAVIGTVAPGPNEAGQTWGRVDVAPTTLTVTMGTTVTPILLRLLAPGSEPLQVTVTRTAEARID